MDNAFFLIEREISSDNIVSNATSHSSVHLSVTYERLLIISGNASLANGIATYSMEASALFLVAINCDEIMKTDFLGGFHSSLCL